MSGFLRVTDATPETVGKRAQGARFLVTATAEREPPAPIQVVWNWSRSPRP